MNYQNAYIDIPPWLPIPGTAIFRSDGGSEPFGLPAYMGRSFTELCWLTPLINEMLHNYHDSGDGVAPTSRASFSFAQGLYRRLLGWADAVPVAMARGGDMPHHVATVHIFFHTAVLDLFRPFPYQQPETPFMLDNLPADDPTPAGICRASVNQLKHLILVFRSRYPSATSSMLWQNALLYVANACLPLNQAGAADRMEGVTPTAAGDDGELADEWDGPEEDAHRRKWFMACVDALQALAPQFEIVTGIVQGILSMAILKGSIAAVEGRAIMDRIKADTEAPSRHRREHFALNSAGGGGGAAPDDGPEQQEEEGEGEEGEEGGETSLSDGLREGSEEVARVVYGSSGGRSGDGPGLTFSGLLNLPGAQRGGNGFVIDLNEASVNPSAASLDVLARAFDELTMFDEFTTGEG